MHLNWVNCWKIHSEMDNQQPNYNLNDCRRFNDYILNLECEEGLNPSVPRQNYRRATEA